MSPQYPEARFSGANQQKTFYNTLPPRLRESWDCSILRKYLHLYKNDCHNIIRPSLPFAGHLRVPSGSWAL